MRRVPASTLQSAAREAAGPAPAGARYALCLYVTGTAPHSTRAIVNVRRMCEDHLRGRYDLEVVDLTQHPSVAAAEKILAAPTLVKKLPLPPRRFIGDMSQTDRLLLGLELRPREHANP